MTLRCTACRHQWQVVLRAPLRIMEVCARLTAAAEIGCPKCLADGREVECVATKRATPR